MNKITDFIRGMYLELSKVNWLDRKTVLMYTTLVLIVLVLGTLLVFGVDQGFSYLRKEILFQSI